MRADLPRERVDLRLDAAQGQRPQRGRVDPLLAGQVQLTDDQPPVAVLPDPDMHPLRNAVVGEGDPAALADGELAQRPDAISTAWFSAMANRNTTHHDSHRSAFLRTLHADLRRRRRPTFP